MSRYASHWEHVGVASSSSQAPTSITTVDTNNPKPVAGPSQAFSSGSTSSKKSLKSTSLAKSKQKHPLPYITPPPVSYKRRRISRSSEGTPNVRTKEPLVVRKPLVSQRPRKKSGGLSDQVAIALEYDRQASLEESGEGIEDVEKEVEEDYSSGGEVVLVRNQERQNRSKIAKKPRARPKAKAFKAMNPASDPAAGDSPPRDKDQVVEDGDMSEAMQELEFSRSTCPSPLSKECLDGIIPKVEPDTEEKTLFARPLSNTQQFEPDRHVTPVRKTSNSPTPPSIRRLSSISSQLSPPRTSSIFSRSTTSAPPSSIASDLLSISPTFAFLPLNSNKLLQLDFLAPLLVSLGFESFSQIRKLASRMMKSTLELARKDYEKCESPQGCIDDEDWKKMSDLLVSALDERQESRKFWNTVL